jgi:two-component system LytT family response regulator
MPPPPLTTLIVDDEELARRGLKTRLQQIPRVEIAGMCSSGQEAVDAIRNFAPDLVLLDIQMPGLDGFDVIERVGPEAMPLVIFITAYDEHALRAFDVHALDYLLKPIDEDRFQESLSHARRRLSEQEAGALGNRLEALLNEASGAPPEDDDGPTERFVVKQGGRIRFVEADAIRWIEAAGDYVRLHTDDKAHLLRETMKGMEDQLDPDRFLRIHRSTIINTAHLEELRPYGNSEYIAVLDDGTERKLSRTYRDALTAFFDGAI